MRKVDKARQILNILFIIGAVATFIIYMTSGKCPTFMYVGFSTLAINIFEFILRFVN